MGWDGVNSYRYSQKYVGLSKLHFRRDERRATFDMAPTNENVV